MTNPIDKHHFIHQLRGIFVQNAAGALRAESDAREASRTVATESEKKEDGRVAIEFNGLANGQALRGRRSRDDIAVLDTFAQRGLVPFKPNSPVGLGALVDVAIQSEHGSEERTMLFLPVGAGCELSGPGGDGFVSVVTPQSPVGRALIGKRPGDTVEATVAGEWREWTILEVA